MSQILDLAVQVMLPLTLLVAAGGLWPVIFPATQVAELRTQLNRLVMYLFYPCILFAVAATTPIDASLLSVPLLVGIGTLAGGALIYALLYWTPLGRGVPDATRAILVVGGMFGNTFNVGVPVLQFFFGAEALRYAVYNDVLMTMPLVWSLGVWLCMHLGKGVQRATYASVLKVTLTMPPLWAFALGFVFQQSGLTFPPLISAASMIGQATIPVVLFVLGLTVPWRNLVPRREILGTAMVKLLVAPLIVWGAAHLLYHPPEQAQFAAVVEATTPAMMSGLMLADRFKLDHEAAALLIGWSTILFWFSLPLLMTLGLLTR
ncbi:MAG: AEC family transporter [Burkholderiales bacterium]